VELGRRGHLPRSPGGAGQLLLAVRAAGDFLGGSDPSGSPAAVSGLPPGCETIDLRAPDGSPVDLEGVWDDVSRDDSARMMWWTRTAGNCFYGVGTVDPDIEYSDSFSVQTFSGVIQPDFTIRGAFVHLGGHNDAETIAEYVPATLLIEFQDDGTIAIREDREPNVPGPRCPRPEVCAQPMDLRW
jgi:hypothetical protein